MMADFAGAYNFDPRVMQPFQSRGLLPAPVGFDPQRNIGLLSAFTDTPQNPSFPGGLVGAGAPPQAPQMPQAAPPGTERAAMSLGPAMTPNAGMGARGAAPPSYLLNGPLGQFARANQTGLQTLASGLLSGSRRGLSQAIGAMPQAQQMDRQNAALADLTRGMDPQTAALARAFPQLYAQQAFTKPETTSDITNFDFAQRNPGFAEFLRGNRAAGASNVTVTQAGETAYAQSRGKKFAEMAGEFDTSYLGALDTLQSLDAMETLASDPAFYSGPLAESVVLPLRQTVAALGGDPAGAKSMEAFNAFAKKAALDTMGGSLGTGFSNADRDFVLDQVPSLGNSPAGNQALVEIQRAMAERKIEMAQIAQEYERLYGRLDNNFLHALDQWAEANPVFGNEFVERITGIGRSGSYVSGSGVTITPE